MMAASMRMAARRGADRRRRRSAPHLARRLDDLAQLRPLRLLGEDVALLGRRKAALRRERELLQRSEFRRFVDAALDVVLLFQRAVFEVTRPSTTIFWPFGRNRSGSKPPARSVSYSRK